MNKLPVIKAKDFEKALVKMGFKKIRQHGSHIFFEHPDGRTTVVPNHPTEELDRHLMNKIIKHDLQISREEFLKHL
ncbi:MAG: type II toxin-antitoxin system HicA family toxin [Nanoarchaeota archaeon]